MKRREFVKSLAIASAGAPILMKNGIKLQSLGKEMFKVADMADDRVLVIIRLNGGNDGLSTVIPRDQYANLTIQRSNVLIPETQVLPLTTEVGLHPVMTGMQTMYNNGNLGIIQNVGYPDQNRSHFRSMDIWTSGLINSPADTGWLGRNFDTHYPNYPSAYPDAQNPDPFAISMGYEVSTTCQGLMANFSHAVADPSTLYNLTSSPAVNDGTYYGSHIEYLTTLIDQANAYGAQINAAASAGNSNAGLYDIANNPLAEQLHHVANMIHGGLKTKVYVLNINGFDTHDSQVLATDTTQGLHADLIWRLSDAISSFQADITALGLQNRVAGMTFSEFGRQVASNASFGTDHGDAAPMFLFGACLDFQIMGPNPVIGNTIVNQEAIPMQIDFRDVYASILKDWFGVDPVDIQPLFEHSITYIPLLGACNIGIDEIDEISKDHAIIYPNPVRVNATIRFAAENEWVKVDVYDLTNKKVAEIYDGNLSAGRHDIKMELSHLTAGQYVVLIRKESGTVHSNLVKVD
jgi:uncharacterized protein (DUF1501 family)